MFEERLGGTPMKIVALAVLLSVSLVAQEAPVQPGSVPNAGNASQNAPLSQRGIERITEEVRHRLVLLPYYGVFDNLAFKVSPDGTVTLLGQVSRPTLKSDAERTV